MSDVWKPRSFVIHGKSHYDEKSCWFCGRAIYGDVTLKLEEGRLVCHRALCQTKVHNHKLKIARSLGVERTMAPIPVGATMHRVPILSSKIE